MPNACFKPLCSLLVLACLPGLAAADIVTGKVTPANAKAIIVDATGKTVAELKPGDSVLVRFGPGDKGLMAAEVRPLEAALPRAH